MTLLTFRVTSSPAFLHGHPLRFAKLASTGRSVYYSREALCITYVCVTFSDRIQFHEQSQMQQKLMTSATNCFLSNLIKNMNSLHRLHTENIRKLEKFKST